MAPAKLIGTSYSVVQSEAPLLCTLLYLRPCYLVFYWLWVIYPMGKHALILKGSACSSSILCSCNEGFYHALQLLWGCIFIYTLYCAVQYSLTVLLSYCVGYVRKLITLQ